jgi:uncharacterized protein Yka (UPF0111/DUF47 family)
MGNKAKQRFIDLVVNEVSLVDSPANEQEFVVIKNLTEEVCEMSQKEVTKDKGDSQSEIKNAPEKVPVEVQKENDVAIASALEQVNKMIGSIAKAVEDAAKVEKTVEDMEESSDGTVAKSSKESDDSDDSNKNGVQKNSEDFGAKEEGNDDVEKTLIALGSAVEKAKRFTPKREMAFKAALAALTNLAKELGMMEIPVGQSPSTSTPKGTMFGASSVSKSLEELASKVEGMVVEVKETTKRLEEKVERIEKARKPSKSVESEGGTDDKSVKKNFWSGIL